jgi:hypothetical protein
VLIIKKEIKDIILKKVDSLLCDIVRYHLLEAYLMLKYMNEYSYHYFDVGRYLMDKKFEHASENIEAERLEFLLKYSSIYMINIFIQTLIENDTFIEKADFRKLNIIYKKYKNKYLKDTK